MTSIDTIYSWPKRKDAPVTRSDLRDRAVLMRSSGASLIKICDELKAPKSTVWGWIKDVKLTGKQMADLKVSGDEALRRAQKLGTEAMIKKYKILEGEAIEVGRLRVESMGVIPEILLAGILLYWAEGNKRGNLKFSNSDARMVKIFIDFLLEFMGVTRKEIRVQLCFYDNVKSKSEVENYWEEITGIKKSEFYKSQVNKKPQAVAGQKVGKLPYGVCSISVSSRYKNYEMRGMIGAVVKRLGA